MSDNEIPWSREQALLILSLLPQSLKPNLSDIHLPIDLNTWLKRSGPVS